MDGDCWKLHLVVIVFSAILTCQATALTDPLDVAALQDLYRTLNAPPELKGWRLDGADPCKEMWTGVACLGSSVIYLRINGLNLTGYLGNHLNNLYSLKQLDISSNNIWGEIPSSLPTNAAHINLASNFLSQNIPHSLTTMKSLRHLNLSHNSLSGPVGNVFTGLNNLREMDLSYNNLSGDLPSSFSSLTNLTRLFLQHNKFSGSVAYLAELPLIDLNIQDNFFSGIIPKSFQSIPNLWIWGNHFHGDSPPWDFPLETVPIMHNISAPPRTQSNAIENYPFPREGGHRKRSASHGGLAFMVGGVTLLATGMALFIVIRIYRLRAQKHKSLGSSHNSPQSLPITAGRDSFALSRAPEETPRISGFNSAQILGTRRLPPVYPTGTTKMSTFSRRSKFPVRTITFTVAELQSATDNFSQEYLLGEGSLGSVYRAQFQDGQILAVKNINMVGLSLNEEDQFLDVTWIASRLRHPNIVSLVGYCVEHGQHLLVYEYVRNLSLDDALHCASYKPLSWGLRVRIALGVAEALQYLHSIFSPHIAHGNLKAANVLLDEDLVPRVCDCGLAILKPLTSNRVKIKASEIAIGDCGYVAPEHGRPGIDNTKSDIYAFGVLLLELLTGRKPFDNSRPREEQSLVKWVSSRLHDSEALEEMVDPGIKQTISSKSLSRFADVVSLCIQPVKEFRPPISEIVESLTTMKQKFNMGKGGTVDSTELDPLEKSFRSTYTRFITSPTGSDASP